MGKGDWILERTGKWWNSPKTGALSVPSRGVALEWPKRE